jgi:hypothetical protein
MKQVPVSNIADLQRYGADPDLDLSFTDAYPRLFTLMRIRVQPFTLMRIRILLLNKVMKICDYWHTDPP